MLDVWKNVSTSYTHPPPFFFSCRAPLVFLSFSSAQKKCIFLIHRKLWVGCFNPAHLGVLEESLVFPPALPGAQVLGGDFLALAGAQGQKMLRRRLRPAGLTARGRAARLRAPGGSRALAPLGTSC
jgi:hypothetical protein